MRIYDMTVRSDSESKVVRDSGGSTASSMFDISAARSVFDTTDFVLGATAIQLVTGYRKRRVKATKNKSLPRDKARTKMAKESRRRNRR